jgi:hypothetical protein
MEIREVFMKARGIQFWTLVLLSSAVSLLMIKEIFLSHALIKAQHMLVDAHEIAESDPVYQSAWQKLAMTIYRAGAQDPAMYDLLKDERIKVHQGPPPGATNTSPVPNAASKPTATLHPATL